MAYKYYYIDLETTANGGPDGTDPEAHWRINRVLLCGFIYNSYGVHKDVGALLVGMEACVKMGDVPVIVAHNAKFDIKYLMRESRADYPWHKVKVWDTMTWEYWDSGFVNKYMSLEKTAKKYNIKFKKSLDLDAILSSGLKMEDIPESDLKEYLESDVEVLYKIHQVQLQKGEYWMDYILPLAEMELNGLPLDTVTLSARQREADAEMSALFDKMCGYITDRYEWQDGTEIKAEDFIESLGTKVKTIKPFANRTLSALLYNEPNPLKIGGKWALHRKKTLGPHMITPPKGEKPSNLGYPVDEAVLERFKHIDFVDWTLQYRHWSKLNGTYYTPFLAQAQFHGTIHPSLNTTATATGRLSSSNPNGQNMPTEARELVTFFFSSMIEELDFSQLEMVGAAVLSGCKKLQSDLKQGLDIHRQTAAVVFGEEQADTMRKIAKNVNFGVLYGGRAAGLSYQTGVDRQTIQKLIDAFFSRYPALARWQRKVYEEVIDNMEPYDIKDGEQRYSSYWQDPISGIRWQFIESEAPQWLRRKLGRKWNISPQHTANYPIQGFCGGGIVMRALWYLWDICKRESLDVKFLLTVHDSIIIKKNSYLDMTEYYDEVMRKVELVYNLPISLQYDVETGKNWR